MKYLSQKNREYLLNLGKDRDYWRKKNRFYYDYLKSFIDFLVPKEKKILDLSDPLIDTGSEKGHFDYFIMSDALGYIDDIEEFFRHYKKLLKSDGRIVITQYSALWEPVLRLASLLRLRNPSIEQNWISLFDLKNFLNLAGFEVIKSGSKMLMPKYIPLVSAFLNKFLANIFPFSRLGLFHYVVARTVPEKIALNPSFSIIVAARNEAGTIEKIVRELPDLGSFTEIVFVEGNSTDNTYEEIKRVAEIYGNKRKIAFAKQDGKGKGDAVKKGFEMATGDILSIYDADMTVPPHEMEKFFRAIAENRAEFINGSRLVYPVEKGAMRILNFFGNKFFSFAFSAILGQPIKDTLCGTKVLWRKDYKDIKKGRSFFGDFDPFGDFDLLFGASKLNRKIIDLPIHYKDRIYGETNISRWKHGWLLLKMTSFAAKKMKFR